MSARKKSSQRENKPVATLKKEKTQLRYLKLKEFYLPRSSKNQRIVPELRLCGKWFEEAGFIPLNYVSVTVMDGLLVIRNVEAIAID